LVHQFLDSGLQFLAAQGGVRGNEFEGFALGEGGDGFFGEVVCYVFYVHAEEFEAARVIVFDGLGDIDYIQGFVVVARSQMNPDNMIEKERLKYTDGHGDERRRLERRSQEMARE
jgi:hypothetical protein